MGTSYYDEPFPAAYSDERTLQAVLITESSLCCHKHGIDYQAYGCGQLHRVAAQVADDTAVSARTLKRNDALNIRLAARYLSYCLQQMSSWERGMVCYNKEPNHTRAMSDAQMPPMIIWILCAATCTRPTGSLQATIRTYLKISLALSVTSRARGRRVSST